jgi:hypothetical protein
MFLAGVIWIAIVLRRHGGLMLPEAERRSVGRVGPPGQLHPV